jgi:histidinol dehydrogenase
MRIERLSLQELLGAGGPRGAVNRLRQLAPTPPELIERVREIVREVAARGDEAVLELTRAHDTAGADPRALLVAQEELDEAITQLPMDVIAGLQVAIANVAEVAQAGVGSDVSLTLPQGQRVSVREVPVQSAAVYVPGGRAPYPSTAVMGVVTARAAGVLDVVVCSPPGPDGQIDSAILGACRLLGVERVYRMGGAQAIAALAFGTETVERVDVIVGPGNLWVQEAKREVSGAVGIDGFAGPSDLMVLLDGGDGAPAPDAADLGPADLESIALDLLAQAEHGTASLVIAASPSSETLDRLADLLQNHDVGEVEPELAPCVLMEVADARMGIELANEFAPEHLQLVGARIEALSHTVRTAGCLLVGAASATAFSDYVAGSNHILPTAGAGRFSSGLSVSNFRRRMSEVRIDPKGAAKLAAAGAPIARAEGFEWHARSMEARVRENDKS